MRALHVCLALACILAFTVQANVIASESEDVIKAVEHIKNLAPSKARESLAMELSKKLGSIPKQTAISTTAIDDIASLLSEDDEMIRRWAAAALGQLGPRAVRSVPALEEALRKAEEEARKELIIHSTTLSDNIRYALQRIRGEPK